MATGDLCNQVARSPATIRAVTNFVLMISDLDIIFSLLFASEVATLGGLWKLGLVVHILGLGTYCAGALYFGPRQKFNTVKMVRERMSKYPEEFKSKRGGPESSVGPHTRLAPGAVELTTFQDLKPDKKGCQLFQQGMGAWGLIHVWNYCEINNAKNTTEVKHSTPLLRLARFGFMAEPTPRDLACILNANALYTFCTGTFQLVFGAILLFAQGMFSLQIVLPLIISGLSFLLSIANVALDFSGMLTAIEGERRLREQILQESDNDRVDQKKRAEMKRDADLKALDDQFAGRFGASDLHDKRKRKAEIMNMYQFTVQEIESHNVSLLEMELMNYRRRLDRIRAVERGVTTSAPEAKVLGRMQAFEQMIAPFQMARDSATQHAAEQIRALNINDMSPEEFDQQVSRIQDDMTRKTKAIDDRLEEMRLQYTGGPGATSSTGQRSSSSSASGLLGGPGSTQI